MWNLLGKNTLSVPPEAMRPIQQAQKFALHLKTLLVRCRWGCGGQSSPKARTSGSRWLACTGLLRYNLGSYFKATSPEMWFEILPKVPRGAPVWIANQSMLLISLSRAGFGSRASTGLPTASGTGGTIQGASSVSYSHTPKNNTADRHPPTKLD